MIRLIILVIGLFLFWLLFLSVLPRKRKIIISVVALALVVIGVWFEGYGKAQRADLISADQVIGCGATGQHSYRSNYNITYCLHNNSASATVRRVNLRFTALRCEANNCTSIEAVEKDLMLLIEPEQKVTATANIAFDQVSLNADNINWNVEVISVKATASTVPGSKRNTVE